jgi:hypothetical protein
MNDEKFGPLPVGLCILGLESPFFGENDPIKLLLLLLSLLYF